MTDLKKIREMAGMSQNDIACWLSISRSMVCMIENGERKLPTAAIFKLSAMMQKLKQDSQVHQHAPGVSYHEPLSLADKHRQKMEKHLALAKSLETKLEKLHKTAPLVNKRELLVNVIKSREVPGHTFTRKEELFMEMQEARIGSVKSVASLAKEQDMLQDKIDTHKAYASLHQERWKMFLDMM